MIFHYNFKRKLSLHQYAPIAMEILFSHWRLKHIEAKTNWTPFTRRHFQIHFLNENVWISIKISLKFVPSGWIDNTPALVQIMAWRRVGAKPSSEPMMISLLTHISVTRPQWVKALVISINAYNVSTNTVTTDYMWNPLRGTCLCVCVFTANNGSDTVKYHLVDNAVVFP